MVTLETLRTVTTVPNVTTVHQSWEAERRPWRRLGPDKTDTLLIGCPVCLIGCPVCLFCPVPQDCYRMRTIEWTCSAAPYPTRGRHEWRSCQAPCGCCTRPMMLRERSARLREAEEALKTIAVAEAAEALWARAKDATKLFEAIRAKLLNQAAYGGRMSPSEAETGNQSRGTAILIRCPIVTQGRTSSPAGASAYVPPALTCGDAMMPSCMSHGRTPTSEPSAFASNKTWAPSEAPRALENSSDTLHPPTSNWRAMCSAPSISILRRLNMPSGFIGRVAPLPCADAATHHGPAHPTQSSEGARSGRRGLPIARRPGRRTPTLAAPTRP